MKFLRSDHSILGAEFVRDGSSGFSFVNVLEAIRFLRPAATNLLEIGLGTGVVPSALGRQGIHVDVAEIDPAVVRFAEQDFEFAPTGDVYIEDARTFLRRTERRYDLVVHDTFTGGTTPDHLLSLEVLQRIHSVLRPDGALALNFAGYYDGVEAQASYAVARTGRAVFRNVRAFRDSAPKDASERIGNIKGLRPGPRSLAFIRIRSSISGPTDRLPAVDLAAGSYTSAQLAALGVADKSISSILLQPGYKVLLCQQAQWTAPTARAY